MLPTTTEHRGIEIRYGYNIAIDGYTANFVLPVKQTMQLTFQRAVKINSPVPPNPGKNHANGDTEGEALARARAMIDSYLDDA